VSRFNLLLVAVAVICALGVVTSQHRARKLFVELEHEQEVTRSLEVEWGQLQLEQSTWALHARIEKLAADRLQMRAPQPSKVQVVPLDTKVARAAP
jgi:cell division protein FtsL